MVFLLAALLNSKIFKCANTLVELKEVSKCKSLILFIVDVNLVTLDGAFSLTATTIATMAAFMLL